MTTIQVLALFAAGILSGALNALAGGGGFITLPALIWSGATPILANTTGTVAVWPGSIAALYAYRRRLRRREHPMVQYLIAVVYGLLFLIAVYGGYFGGGMGIMTLAVLTLIGMRDIHEMNALKSLLVVVICGVGVATFIIAGKVEWSRCLIMASGCILGGYGAGFFVQKIDPIWVRRIIALIALSMTAYFFCHAYA